MAVTISVVMSCYNSPLVVEQLRSIRTQTSLPDQLVVIDDSTDPDIFPMLERELVDFPGEVVLERNVANLGLWLSWSRALALATSTIVACCDHDDVWAPNKIERMRDVFLDPTICGMVSDAAVFDGEFDPDAARAIERRPAASTRNRVSYRSLLTEQGWRRRKDGQLLPLARLLRRNVTSGATLAFRRELLAHILPLPTDMYPDHWIACNAAARGLLVLVNEPLVHYRLHANNTVGLERANPLQSFGDPFRRPTTATLGRLRTGSQSGSAAVVDSWERYLGMRTAFRAKNIGEFRAQLRDRPARTRMRDVRFYPDVTKAGADLLRVARICLGSVARLRS